MSLNITENLRQGIQTPKASPTLVLKLDGIDTIFGNVQIKKFVRIGDPGLVIGNDWLIGGFNLVDDQSPYITFNTGDTTTRINQKLDPSRGLGSSVSQMSLTFIDKDQEITNLIAPGKVVTEMLGRFATIYLGIEESAWPEDYNIIFQGVVESFNAEANVITLYLSNTEERKRAEIMPQISSKSTTIAHYRSALFQDLFYKNREDVTSTITLSYVGGGTAGSEVVTTPTPTSIQVQIQSGVSTAAQVRKAIENSDLANQLVEVEIQGNSANAQVTGSTSLGISSSITFEDASSFILPADTLQTYIKMGEELIRYTGRSGNTLTGVTRAQEGSIGAAHEIGEAASQIVRITDNGITTALKLFLSKGPTYYAENIPILAFEQFDPLNIIPEAIFFSNVDLVRDYGVSVGDYITITGATNVGNNLTDAVIGEIGLLQGGSYVILNTNVILEPDSPAIAKFKSPYNTLPIGLGMKPREVDVAQHIFIRDTYIPVLTLDLYVNDIPNGKEFLEREIYLPMTCFSVPRKGRSSVIMHVGPLPTYEIVSLNETTVKNPESLSVRRSLSENFFNQVRFDYDIDPIENEYETIKPFDSDYSGSFDSVGTRPFIIKSRGLRTDEGGNLIAENSARRYLQRYERGAEFIKGIELMFANGYAVEIGDVVAVDYAALKLADSKTGDRQGRIRLMEVMNKTLDSKNGRVTIDVVNTTFNISDRFGLIAPASIIIAGGDFQKLKIQKSYGTRGFERESFKWTGYVGQKVIVRNETYSQVYETTILGFDNANPQSMLVSPLPVTPAAGWIIEAPNYPSTPSTQDLSFWKFRHAFFAPQVPVTNAVAISQLVFEVSSGNIGKFFVGASVRVHNYAYTQDGPEALITVVDTGLNRVTIDTPTGFNINNTHYVDLIGFSDEQPAYRIM